MVELARRVSRINVRRGRAPWPDHEYVRGWGVFGLPFDSGHVLALRVFPENDFSPYRTLWHRTPDGEWSIYVDGARIDIACPRYYGKACVHSGFARIMLRWIGPWTLRVTMNEPSLQWNVVATETTRLRVLNTFSAGLPLWTWRSGTLLRARERLAKRILGMGDIQLSGIMPSGHTGTLMPQRMYFIDESMAVLRGHDLGRPTVVENNPRIGNIPLPARGVLAIGQAAWQILDAGEYARVRAETAVEMLPVRR